MLKVSKKFMKGRDQNSICTRAKRLERRQDEGAVQLNQAPTCMLRLGSRHRSAHILPMQIRHGNKRGGYYYDHHNAPVYASRNVRKARSAAGSGDTQHCAGVLHPPEDATVYDGQFL